MAEETFSVEIGYKSIEDMEFFWRCTALEDGTCIFQQDTYKAGKAFKQDSVAIPSEYVDRLREFLKTK